MNMYAFAREQFEKQKHLNKIHHTVKKKKSKLKNLWIQPFLMIEGYNYSFKRSSLLSS